MKIALAQVNTTVGDFDRTVAKISSFVSEAKKNGANLLAFPELTLTGYPPRDLVEVPGFVDKNLKALKSVARLAKDIQIVVGYVDRRSSRTGKALTNSAALCRDGHMVATYAKNLLPTYDVFDEGRYFEPGSRAGLWRVSGQKVGISICEDSWNDKLFWSRPLYQRDPVREQVKSGAELLLNISASPYSQGRERQRKDMLKSLAKRHRRPLFYVNLVGGNDELVFDGRSLVLDEKGRVVAEAKAFEEDMIVVDAEELRRGELTSPQLSDIESVYRALVLGLRDYARKCGFQKAVLGLSGGIDSALTTAVAVEALGPGNVIGVMMPSPYSSEGSLSDSKALAANLGMDLLEYPISDVYEAYRRLLKKEGEGEIDLTLENLQSRIRGNILMALSNRHGYLVLSTGNKSELAVGYCTLYGDMSGGLAVISDVPKTTVYELSRLVNQKSGRSIIPEEIFTKPPSAELRPNQTDQDSLPPYETLDPILKMFVEEHRSESEIVRKGFDREVVRTVIQRVNRNEYKRRQAAPGIKVSAKAFGIGRRFPIAKKID